MKFLAGFIMKGRFQATTVASSLAMLSLLVPPVGIVSSAAVALVTLRHGAREGALVLLFSGIAAALLGLVLPVGYHIAVVYGLAIWLPVWLMAIVLREGRQLAVAIEAAVLLGILGVVGFYLFHPSPADMWRDMLNQMIQLGMNGASDIPEEVIQQEVSRYSRLLTGLVAAGVVYGVLFGLFLARWWQSVLFHPGGFRSEFLTLRLHRQLATATLIVLVVVLVLEGLAAANGASSFGALTEVLWNVIVLLFVLYTIVGTAALHDSFAKTKSGRYMVPFLYVTLLLIPHVSIAVALFGLGDTWLDLRSKISNNTD